MFKSLLLSLVLLTQTANAMNEPFANTYAVNPKITINEMGDKTQVVFEDKNTNVQFVCNHGLVSVYYKQNDLDNPGEALGYADSIRIIKLPNTKVMDINEDSFIALFDSDDESKFDLQKAFKEMNKGEADFVFVFPSLGNNGWNVRAWSPIFQREDLISALKPISLKNCAEVQQVEL